MAAQTTLHRDGRAVRRAVLLDAGIAIVVLALTLTTSQSGSHRELDGLAVELPVAAGLARGERERQHDDRDTGVEQDGSSDCTSIAMQRGLRGHWKSDRTAGWTGARLPRGGSERPPWAVARSALEQERRPFAA